MEYKLLFKEHFGFFPHRKRILLLSEPFDLSLFEFVSKLYYEDNKFFLKLKEKLVEDSIPNKDDLTLCSLLGYINYIECNFKKALFFFRKIYSEDPQDLGNKYCITFCFRQLGYYDRFDNLIQYFGGLKTNEKY